MKRLQHGDWKTLRKMLVDQGFTVETRSGNPNWFRATPPVEGRGIVHWTEGSGPDVFRNTLSHLRRSGFNLTSDNATPSSPSSTPDIEPAPKTEPFPPPQENAMNKITVIDRRHIDPDAAFEKLKEARQLAVMAREMRDRAQAQADEANKSLRTAQAELESAERDLIKSKQEFDSVFVVTTSKAG